MSGRVALSDRGELKETMAAVVDGVGETTFDELIERLATLRSDTLLGAARLYLSGCPHIIVWAGLSVSLARCVRDLVADGRICLHEVSPLRYGPRYLQMAQRELPPEFAARAGYVPAVLRSCHLAHPLPASAVETRAADALSFGVPVVPRCFLRAVTCALRRQP